MGLTEPRLGGPCNKENSEKGSELGSPPLWKQPKHGLGDSRVYLNPGPWGSKYVKRNLHQGPKLQNGTYIVA